MKLIEKLRNKPFLKNVLILLSGTAFANLITLLFTPIITRIYGPEEYGYLSVFSSIVYTITPAISLTLPVAIVLAKTDSEAKKLAEISFAICLILSTAVAGLLYIFESDILGYFNLEKLEGVSVLIPITILITGTYFILEQWGIRNKSFKRLAISQTVRTSSIGTSQTIFGFYNPKAAVLIVLYSLGILFQTIYLTIKSKSIFTIQRCELTYKSLIYKYRQFPLYRAPHTVLNSVAFSAPVIVLSSFFGTSTVGYFALAFNMLLVPVTLLGKSFGDVFYAEITNRYQQGLDIAPMLKKAHRSLFLLGIAPFGTVAIAGPEIFGIVFGEEWQSSGIYGQWIAPWLLCVLVSRPTAATIPVLNLQRFMLIHEVIFLSLKLLALYVGISQNDPLISVIGLSITNIVGYTFIAIYVLKRTSKSSTRANDLHES
jgi:O-antigen/teichoic acid export membrane protein